MTDLENLIAMSRVVSKPWVIATWTLSFLLFISVVGNIYMATNGSSIFIDNDSSFVESDNNSNIVNGK